MPFDPGLNWLHTEIVEAGRAERLSIVRADDEIFGPGVFLDQIFKSIDNADLVLAVCTGRNANVFFELGYAWRGHIPILIARDTTDLPSDLGHFRSVMYGGDGRADGMESLRARLRASIRATPRHSTPRAPLAPATAAQQRAPYTPPARVKLHGHYNRYGPAQEPRTFTVTNMGNVDLHDVVVEFPPAATSFQLRTEDMPVPILRPRERAVFHVTVVNGGGPRIFDVRMLGRTGTGELQEFFYKLSV
jgi:hypothetical protein